MLPKLLDISNEKCRGTLRRLELEAYSNVITVFRAQGNLTEQKTKILDELRNVFSIEKDRHRAEIRRANSDELLCTISEKLFGKGTQIEWMKEGRRAFPLLPRKYPLTALTHIATQMSRHAYRENAKLAREEALEKVKCAAMERDAAERAEELEKSKITCTIVSGEEIKQNDSDASPQNDEVKVEESNEFENFLELSKNEDVKLTEEDMAKVNYLELKELLKLSTTITTKTKTSTTKPIKNHIVDKQINNSNIVKTKLKSKKDKIPSGIRHEEKHTHNNDTTTDNDNQDGLEIKQHKVHKKRKRRISRKKKLIDSNQSTPNTTLNNEELNDTNKNDTTSSIIKNIPPTINYDKINQMPVQKCILNIDSKATTSPPTPPIAINESNYVPRTIELKRPSSQPIQTILEPKRINISDAKILKIDNFNQSSPTSQSKSNIICLQKLESSETINHNIPVNIQKINPIIMSNIKLNANNLKTTGGIQQRKRVNLMTSSNGKVFIRPVDEKKSSILSITPPVQIAKSNSLNHIQTNANLNLPPTAPTTTGTGKLNLPTINLTKVSVLDNKTFQPQQQLQNHQIKTNSSMEYYSTTTTASTLNKNYQLIQVQSSPKSNLNLDKAIINSTNNIFVIGSIQTGSKDKYEKLTTVDIKNNSIGKINSKLNTDLITEDTPVDIVNESVLQYNDSIIVEDEYDEDDGNKNSLNNSVNNINDNSSNSNNHGNSKNNQENFYKNYGETSTGSMMLENEKNKFESCIGNLASKTSEQIAETKTTTIPSNEVDWELELDQQAQKANNESYSNNSSNNNGVINNYTNNCIIYKNINNNEKTSNNFNDYIEEIVEESISDDESGNTINNGYYNFQEEEEECIDVDDSTINAIKN